MDESRVDAIMARIPETWRDRWCGGETGPCACMGCVQTGNKKVIAEKIAGQRYTGDPEYIDEFMLMAHADIYAANKITRGDWDAWRARHPTGD
jgi:hypothetical protein